MKREIKVGDKFEFDESIFEVVEVDVKNDRYLTRYKTNQGHIHYIDWFEKELENVVWLEDEALDVAQEVINLEVDHVNRRVVSALDIQVGGGHYPKDGIQPIEYIHANKLGFIEGNVVKYITRHREKNGVEDLKKIKHYIDLLIELEYEK